MSARWRPPYCNVVHGYCRMLQLNSRVSVGSNISNSCLFVCLLYPLYISIVMFPKNNLDLTPFLHSNLKKASLRDQTHTRGVTGLEVIHSNHSTTEAVYIWFRNCCGTKSTYSYQTMAWRQLAELHICFKSNMKMEHLIPLLRLLFSVRNAY